MPALLSTDGGPELRVSRGSTGCSRRFASAVFFQSDILGSRRDTHADSPFGWSTAKLSRHHLQQQARDSDETATADGFGAIDAVGRELSARTGLFTASDQDDLPVVEVRRCLLLSCADKSSGNSNSDLRLRLPLTLLTRLVSVASLSASLHTSLQAALARRLGGGGGGITCAEGGDGLPASPCSRSGRWPAGVAWRICA